MSGGYHTFNTLVALDIDALAMGFPAPECPVSGASNLAISDAQLKLRRAWAGLAHSIGRRSRFMVDATLERVLKRDRVITVLGLGAIATLAWLYTIFVASMVGGDMAGAASHMTMPRVDAWSDVDFLLMFAMWAVMMVAMMLPSASPMILLFAKVNRTQRQAQTPYLLTSLFAGSYVIVWAGFALIATAANSALHNGGLMTSMMGSALPLWGGGLLIAAGLYQFTPLKYACLNKCRNPLFFLMSEWRDGALGAFVMGLRHGAYCVGCCWVLMALLFVLGVMNLAWISLLAAFVLIEKLVSSGPWLSRGSGLLLLAWGIWILV
jgi:predicted metal-binding membrane protein